MRIVQVIDQLRLVGGAERLQVSFAEALRDEDVELTIVTLQRGEPEAEAELTALGARLVCIPAARFLSPSRARRVLRFLRDEPFDVLHGHLVRSTILGSLAGRAAGIPTVSTLHNTRPSNRLPRGLWAVEALVLRHVTDRVVAVGWETARAHEERLGHRRIDVIPNAVAEAAPMTAEERARLRADLGVGRHQLLVLAVGRHHVQKAYPDLLRAFAQLDPGLGAELRIAGCGRLEHETQAEIDRLRLGDRAKLLGLRRDVPRLLAASDVYASSAAWEGMPLAMLEAMAAGLPIVATGVGDVPRVVDETSGLLVPPGRPEELAGALARLLADPKRRRALGEGARRRATEDFGARRWARRLLSLYAELGPDEAAPEAPGTAEEQPCASPW